jgi:hypothetical protein
MINIFRGEDAEIPFVLRRDGLQQALNIDLGDDDNIEVILPGETENLVKTAQDGDVIINSDECGLFKCVLDEDDTLSLRAGANQNIVIIIKRGQETIIRELERVLFVRNQSLTNPSA